MPKTLAVVLLALAFLLTLFSPASFAENGTTTTEPTRIAPSQTTQVKGPTAAEIAKWNKAVKAAQVKRYINAVLWSRFVAHIKAEQARAKVKASRGLRLHNGGTVAYYDGTLICNGTTLVPCWVVKRESRFQPRAENPTSTASGLYQFIDRTWRWCAVGYGHASYAPVSVQAKCAKKLWNNGAGRSHWGL